MKDYLIQCIVEWLNSASEQNIRVLYAYTKRLLHK